MLRHMLKEFPGKEDGEGIQIRERLDQAALQGLTRQGEGSWCRKFLVSSKEEWWKLHRATTNFLDNSIKKIRHKMTKHTRLNPLVPIFLFHSTITVVETRCCAGERKGQFAITIQYNHKKCCCCCCCNWEVVLSLETYLLLI